MKLRIAVIMDPIESINPKKDSTLAMLLAAKKREWEITYLQQHELRKEGGTVYAHGTVIDVFDDLESWHQPKERVDRTLDEFDAILMRKDPPFDSRFLYTTHLLDYAEQHQVVVVNRPQSLRDCNEKIFATEFPELCPPVLITAEAEAVREFHREHSDIILKPLDGMGGESIFRAGESDPNINVIIETLSARGSQLMMAQRYIPEIVDGDKRILLIDGEPVPFALARIPSQGETRGNLAAGGTGVAKPLTDNDRKICQRVGPTLRERGLLFVGIDVIGNYLTEINVTSPTCIRELDAQCDLDIGGQLMDEIASRVQQR